MLFYVVNILIFIVFLNALLFKIYAIKFLRESEFEMQYLFIFFLELNWLLINKKACLEKIKTGFLFNGEYLFNTNYFSCGHFFA